jgi:cbb3-type cytochrome oxidase maturation protein
MSVIYILIPIAILLTAIGIYLFFWAVKTEQFEDLEKQGMSILFDDSNDNDHHVNPSDGELPITEQEKNPSKSPTHKPAKK